MSIYKSEEQHKENLKNLGQAGGLVVVYFAACYLAVYFNMDYMPRFPWFIVVVIVGGFFIVPRARAVMKAFEDNTKN